MANLLNLVEDLLRHQGRLPLIRNKRLIDIKSVLVHDEGGTPFLRRNGHRVGRLDPDKKPSLEIQNGINVEEDGVHDIAGYRSFLFESCLEVMQVLQILYVFALGVDQLLDDVVPIGHLGFLRRIFLGIFGIWLELEQQATLLSEVKDIVDNLGNLFRCQLDTMGLACSYD